MYKRYNRLKNIMLPAIVGEEDELRMLLISRSSYRGFSSQPIELKALSEILYYSAGIVRVDRNSQELHRPYPSAGAKYPLEVYVLVFCGKDIQQGLYHYDPLTHALDVLLSPVLSQELKNIWMSQQWFRKAAAIFIITAAYKRTTDKYGDKGLPFPFIEAGHLVQNVYLLAQTMNIGCCAIGQFREKELIGLLDIDPQEEFPLYYVALGN